VIRRAAALFAAVLALHPLAVSAQQPEVEVTVSPDRFEPAEPLDDRRFSGTVRFTNNGNVPVRLELSLRELWHDLEGNHEFTDRPAIQNAFQLSVTTMDLAPEEQKPVEVSGTIPSDRRAAYLGVVANYTIQSGSAVEERGRLASLLLLRGPKPWDDRFTITSAGLLGDGKTAFAIVKNIGDVHVAPTGTIEIKKGTRVYARIPIGAKVVGGTMRGQILPTCDGGCARRYTGAWKPPAALKGPLKIIVKLRSPPAQFETDVPYGDDGAAGPTASIALTTVTPDRIVAVVRNTGTVTIERPFVQMQALQNGTTGRALKDFPGDDLRPEQSRTVTWEPGPVPDGPYVVVAQARTGSRTLAEARADFRVGEPPATGRSGSGRALAVLALILLIVAGIFVILLWKRRRAREQT
jgi:hypothetical protein